MAVKESPQAHQHMPQAAGERLAVSITMAAQLASVGRTTVYQEIRAGRLTPVKIRGRTLIEADELRRWLAAGRGAA